VPVAPDFLMGLPLVLCALHMEKQIFKILHSNFENFQMLPLFARLRWLLPPALRKAVFAQNW